jgi:hypothetical protein
MPQVIASDGGYRGTAILRPIRSSVRAGFGLDPATEVVGHDDDGGYLITTVYTKLDQRRARS